MAQTKIVFLVLPKIYLIDLAGAVQVFQEAQDYGADIIIEYCALTSNVDTATPFALSNLKHFSEVTLDRGDYLFVPGSQINYFLSKELAAEKELITWVQAAHTNGAYICSICTGAFFLGITGLLNGKKCTTHWKRTGDLKKHFPEIDITEDILFTEDQRIFTSAGVTAGIDLALYILGRITDENISYKVARELVVYLRRKGNEAQQSIFMKYRSHIHTGIHKVQDYLQEKIQHKMSLIQLADIACMSTRNLTRTFKKKQALP